MFANPESTNKATSQLGALIDLLLNRFSYYVVPIVLAVFTMLVLVQAANPVDREHAPALAIPMLLEPDNAGWSPEQAQEQLAIAPAITRLDTRLSESPVWLALPAQPSSGEPRVFELPSRHAQSLDCWRADTLAPLGAGNRASTTGAVSAFRAGFAVPATSAGAICRVVHSGPAVVTATSWPEASLSPATQRFQWGAGLFEGALVMLALFALFTALINRESRYALLAVWLIGNLRLGGITMGWDSQWLGWTIPPDWMHMVRQITIGAYYIVTYTLFRQVFAKELEQLGDRSIRFGQRLGVLLLVAAIALPFAQFLPVMWVIVTIGASIIVVFMVRCLLQLRTRAIIWYSAALGLVLFASLSEVIAAAFDFQFLVGAFNSVTAALAASLMAAFAFADQVRQERRTRWRAQAELERTYQVTPVGLFTLNEQGRFLRVNNAMHQMPGLPTAPLHATRWHEVFDDASWQKLQSLADADDNIEFEVSCQANNDDAVWFLVRAARVGDWIEGSLQDITERQKFTERLRYLANYDSLTGVLNRRGIERELKRALEETRSQPDATLAVAYVDLDRFKLINDLYGHNTGDEVLRQVCERIQATLHEGLQVGRIGGDEFLLVLPGLTMADAIVCCQRVIDSIVGRHFQVRTQSFQVLLSVGLVEVTPELLIKDVIATADRACRDAKARRPGRLAVYERNAAAFAERERELQLFNSLGSNFQTQDLFLLMQPILSLHAPHASMDFEVLVRMRGPKGEVIAAGPLVAAAEANGNIAALDKWVLRTTLHWIQANRAQLSRTRFVCVNLSGASLNDESFLREVCGILGDFRDVAHLLCIEITEGVALHDIDNSRRFIEDLRQFGPRIALDDFGAGYTSFLYIKELSADALKIDGSFVQAITHHPANVAIIEAIVQLARNLGMRSIAEWVEDHATLELLAELGVDYVQGYLISEPVSPERILAATSPLDFITDPATREHMARATRVGFGQIDSDIDLPAATPYRYH